MLCPWSTLVAGGDAQTAKRQSQSGAYEKNLYFPARSWRVRLYCHSSLSHIEFHSLWYRYRKEEKKKRFRKMGQEEARKKSKESSAKDWTYNPNNLSSCRTFYQLSDGINVFWMIQICYKIFRWTQRRFWVFSCSNPFFSLFTSFLGHVVKK